VFLHKYDFEIEYLPYNGKSKGNVWQVQSQLPWVGLERERERNVVVSYQLESSILKDSVEINMEPFSILILHEHFNMWY